MEEKKLQKRAIESREKLLLAAWKLFCEKGYFNTNTKEIAKEAGISVGNFYNYFQDKAAVYDELAYRYLHGSAQAVVDLEDILKKIPDRREVIKNYIESQMARAAATGRFFSDCQVLMRDDENLKKIMDQSTHEVMSSSEQLLKKLPEVKKRAPYPIMARILFNVVERLTEDSCGIQDKDEYDEYIRQIAGMVHGYIFGDIED